MKILRQITGYIAIGTALFTIGTTVASADQAFKKLSEHHVLYGVSQYLAGNITVKGSTPLKIFNPTPVAQVSAAILYERDNQSGDGFDNIADGVAGKYQDCLVRALAPHGAVQLDLNFLPVNRGYAEIVSVPIKALGKAKSGKSGKSDKSKKSKKRRIADGLGIMGTTTVTNFVSIPMSTVHPSLFSLPSDSVVPGQQQAAVDCICGAIPAGVDSDVFQEFGISCP